MSCYWGAQKIEIFPFLTVKMGDFVNESAGQVVDNIELLEATRLNT